MEANGWVEEALADCVQRVVGGGTPSRQVPSFWQGSIPWASVKDLSDDDLRLETTEEQISSDGLAASAANLIAPGTPVVCTRMAVGRCAAADQPVAINQDLKALEPKPHVDPRFLLHALKNLRPFFEAKSTGSTVNGVSLQDLLSAPVGRPPLPEQRRIAEILDLVDESIRDTNQIIKKLRALRQGIVHDLLTRGINTDGKRRNPERHPEQFRVSVLGKLPKDWKIVRLGDAIRRSGGFIQTGPFGSQLHASEYVADGVPVVMPQDIDDGNFTEAHVARITLTRANDLKRHRLKDNDVVFARRGELSRCAAVSDLEEDWLCGTGCLLVRPPLGMFDASWLAAV